MAQLEILGSVELQCLQPLFFAQWAVQAGFPSPAEDFAAKRIDLTQELVYTPSDVLDARGWAVHA